MPVSFIDSNVILYFASADAVKAERARTILREGGVVSVQVLNEVAHVARRKMRLDWPETRHLLETLRGLVAVMPVTAEMHGAGTALAERYGLSIWDSMILAAALASDCGRLWSEDLQAGMLVAGRLRIENPFLGA